jgi:hypothetical protein
MLLAPRDRSRQPFVTLRLFTRNDPVLLGSVSLSAFCPPGSHFRLDRGMVLALFLANCRELLEEVEGTKLIEPSPGVVTNVHHVA